MSELEYAGRFETALIDGVPALVIPGQRNWGIIIWYGLFILPWTAGGVVAALTLLRSFNWFVLLWLAFWAWGWTYVAGTLAWNVDGKDIVRVVAGKLEIQARALGLRWTKRVPVDRIRGIRTAPGNVDDRALAGAGTIFVGLRRYGAVQFQDLWRTVHIAPGLYPEEGQGIVDALTAILPGTAKQPLTRENFPRG
jgi:hypothetical protein